MRPSFLPVSSPRRRFLTGVSLALAGLSASARATALNTISQSRNTERDWVHFERSLAAALTDLGVDEYLVLSARRNPTRYVQFACEGGYGIYAEASARRTSPDPRETDATGPELVRLGWTSPSDGDADSDSNYSAREPWPAGCDGLARLAVQTLRSAYGITHPTLLQYRAFSFNGLQLRFPSLRITRA